MSSSFYLSKLFTWNLYSTPISQNTQGLANASADAGSNFSDSFSAYIATSNWSSDGSRVVRFCSQIPGSVINLKIAPDSFLPAARMISYETPAISGIIAIRVNKFKVSESNLTAENTPIETS